MNDIVTCNKCKTFGCLVKQYCSTSCLTKINVAKRQNRYKRGEYILKENDPVYGLYIIQKGSVKVLTSEPNRKDHIVRLATEGHVIGHRGYSLDKYYVSAVAMSDSVICFLDNELVHKSCMDSPEFAIGLMNFYSYELKKAEIRMKHFIQMNVREKVASALVYIYEAFGINNKTKTLRIFFSRPEIAALAGTTPEQVTRHLSDFEVEKLIVKHKREIQICDIKELKYIIRKYNN